jgi:hypothetical protein
MINYGREYFGKHVIIQLRYKLSEQQVTEIAFAFEELIIIPSAGNTKNPYLSFFKIKGCLPFNKLKDFNLIMLIAQQNALIIEAEHTIAMAGDAIEDLIAKESVYAEFEDFDLNLLT